MPPSTVLVTAAPVESDAEFEAWIVDIGRKNEAAFRVPIVDF